MLVVLRRLCARALSTFVFAILTSSVALAAPRRVVIINAARDQSAGFSAAKTVRAKLAASAELDPLGSGDLSRALEEPLDDQTPTQRALAEAQGLIAAAEDYIDVQFKPRQAKTELDRAEEVLLSIAPIPEVRTELARINFLFGLVHLGDQNRGLAIAAFQLSRTLAPARSELDAGRYKPDIVSAFKAAGAQATAAASSSITISATFDVPIYIDGAPAGTSPVTMEIAPGAHYVTAASREYRVVSAKIDVSAGESLTRKLELTPIGLDEQARLLRADARANMEAGSSVQLAWLAREVVAIAGAEVDAAMVIAEDPATGEVAASIYQSHLGSLSYFRPVTDDVEDMFGLLVPVPAPVLVEDVDGGRKPRWWETRPGIIGLVGGGVGVAAALTVLTLSLTSSEPPRNRSIVLTTPAQ